jgi:hypothetical protein
MWSETLTVVGEMPGPVVSGDGENAAGKELSTALG